MSRRHKYSMNVVSHREDSSDYSSDKYKSEDSEDMNSNKKVSHHNNKHKIKILKKNLVYCIGLSPEIARQEILEKDCYMGQYGKIEKIAIHKNGFNNKNQKGPSYSTYITYLDQIQAALAILALNNLIYNDRLIRASYGTTKYCNYFLKKIQCPNIPQCFFLHNFDKSNQIDERENKPNKSIFESQQWLAHQIVVKNYKRIKERYKNKKPGQPIFPSVEQLLIEFVQNKQHENPQKHQQISKCKSQESSCLDEIQMKKSVSVSTDVPNKHSQSLQAYISRLILNTCMKQTHKLKKSRLWFVQQAKQQNTQSCSASIKKYLVQQFKQAS